MNQPVAITRREALAAGLGIVVAGNLAAAPVPKAGVNPSWVGKTVLPKKFALQGSSPWPANDPVPLNPDGTRPEIPLLLEAASYVVKAEKGTRIAVLHSGGNTCWVEKADVILLHEAVDFFSKILKEDQKDTFAIISRGWTYHLLEKHDKAIDDFTTFLKLTPEGEPVGLVPQRWEGLVNRGLVFAEQGEFKKGLADLDEAVKVWPGSGIAHVNRGYTYELMGEYVKALEDYRKVGHLLAGNNVAWLLATCPDAMIRDGAEAIRIAKIVCDRSDDCEGMYLDTLAAAYAEAGKFDDAVKTQEKALEDKSYAIRYGEEGQKRLQLYKDKKPFRTEPVKK